MNVATGPIGICEEKPFTVRVLYTGEVRFERFEKVDEADDFARRLRTFFGPDRALISVVHDLTGLLGTF